MKSPVISVSNELPKPIKKFVGLASSEARRRLKEFGFNEPVKTRKSKAVVQFLLLFAQPLIIILLIASAISVFVGDWVNAAIITLMVFLANLRSRSSRAGSRILLFA